MNNKKNDLLSSLTEKVNKTLDSNNTLLKGFLTEKIMLAFNSLLESKRSMRGVIAQLTQNLEKQQIKKDLKIYLIGLKTQLTEEEVNNYVNIIHEFYLKLSGEYLTTAAAAICRRPTVRKSKHHKSLHKKIRSIRKFRLLKK